MDAFDQVGGAALFEHDPRPTAVLDLASGHASTLVYRNHAFNRLRGPLVPGDDDAEEEVEYGAFLAWANAPPSGPHSAWNHTWTSFIIQDRWKVVCSGGHGKPFSDVPEDARTIGAQSPSVSSTSTTSLPAKVSTLIDWTVDVVPDISDYIKWFKALDWSKTALGPMAGWSIQLRHLIITIMQNPDPRLVLWGPKRITLYNEACVPIIGQKHPRALGQGPEITFAELWGGVEPFVSAAENGKTSKLERLPLVLARSGFDEECFFTFIMQPICGADGRVAGVMDSFTEVTSAVLADRRMSLIMQIGEACVAADDMDNVWKKLLTIFSNQVDDIPFALLYSIISTDSQNDAQSDSSSHPSDYTGAECILQGSIGAQLHRDVDIDRFPLFQDTDDLSAALVKPFREAWSSRRPVLIRREDSTLPPFLEPAVSGRAGGLPTSQAVVIPVPSLSGSNLVGVIVVGISARVPFNDDYKSFIRLLNDRVAHSVATVALPKEQRIAQEAFEEAALQQASLSRQLLLRTQEAERREAKFARLYDQAPVGMYLLRNDGSPIYLNEAYSKLTGINRTEELRYDTAIWREQILSEDVHIVENAWAESLLHKSPFLIDYRLRRPWHTLDEATGMKIEGTTWLRASGFPDVDDEGNVTSITGWVTDVSLQKWTEKIQQKRLEEALEAKYQSERFIDTVSHEIRNPLSAILQSADGISMTMKKLEAQAAGLFQQDIAATLDSAQTIVFCTQHQKRIVDDILTFSKLDSNLIVLAPEVVVPTTLLDRALNMFAAELTAADITARIDVKMDPMEIVCDASRVLQILINLLTNAIKFTRASETRHVTLSLRACPQPSELWQSETHFIPRRKSRPTSHFNEEWGTGDEVYLEFSVSDTGKGLTQPEMDHLFRRFAQASPKTYSQYGGSGLGLFISKELCELHGGQIGVSSTFGIGSSFTFYIKALQHISSRAESPPLRRASLVERASPKPNAGTSLETAPLMEPNVTDTPIDLIPLPTLGGQMTTSQPAKSMPTSSALTAADLSILVVEDNLINQKVMAAQLRLAGCHVSVANHGEEALAFLESSSFAHPLPPSPQPLSVILMDVEMPVMDGLTAARKIRLMQEAGTLTGHVPVAAVTANARSTQVSDALDAGMDIVVTKPFRISEIIPRIIALVGGYHVANGDPVYAFVDSMT